MPKQPKESRDTRKAMARLAREGWVARPGKGDHVIFTKPGHDPITIDTGCKEVNKWIFKEVKEKAGW